MAKLKNTTNPGFAKTKAAEEKHTERTPTESTRTLEKRRPRRNENHKELKTTKRTSSQKANDERSTQQDGESPRKEESGEASRVAKKIHTKILV